MLPLNNKTLKQNPLLEEEEDNPPAAKQLILLGSVRLFKTSVHCNGSRCKKSPACAKPHNQVRNEGVLSELSLENKSLETNAAGSPQRASSEMSIFQSLRFQITSKTSNWIFKMHSVYTH